MPSLLEGLSAPVIWACLGLALVIAEVFSGTLILLFFGVAGVLVGGAAWAGLSDLAGQVLMFGLLGVAGTIMFRRRLKEAFQTKGHLQPDEKQIITLSAGVPAGGEATISYQGSPWTAMNESTAPLGVGERAVIVRTDGSRLVIRPVGRTFK